MAIPDCCICQPEAMPAEGEDGWLVFCNDHEPSKEVMMASLTGEDPKATFRWAKKQIEEQTDE